MPTVYSANGAEAMAAASDFQTSYWQARGFSREPFDKTAKNAFFMPEAWPEQLESLQHSVQYSNQVVVIGGEPGVGKSTFLQQFDSSIAALMRCHQIKATEALNPLQLLLELAEVFQLGELKSNELAEAKQAFLTQLQANRQPALVMVDDADQLSEQTLLTLFELIDSQDDNSALLRVILVSHNQFAKHIEQLVEQHKIHQPAHSVMLGSLSADETSAYIDQCLQLAGIDEPLTIFDAASRQKMYRLSLGIFARINRVAEQTFMAGVAKAPVWQRFIPGKKSIWLGAAFAVIGSVGVTFWLNRPQANNVTQLALPNNNDQQKVATTKLAEKPVVAVKPQAPWRPMFDFAHYLQALQYDTPSALAVIPEVPKLRIVKQSQVSSKPKSEPTQQAKVDDLPLATSHTADLIGQGLTDLTSEHAKATTTHVDDETTTKSNIVSAQVEVKAEVMQKAQPEVAKKKPPQEQPQLSAATKKLIANKAKKAQLAKKTKAISKGNYALQLFVSGSERGAQRFIAKHKIAGHAHYYRKNYQGDELFVVIYGDYKTRAEAKRAVAKLAKPLRQLKPWPRPYREIKHAQYEN